MLSCQWSRQLADDADDALGQQVARRDAFDQQPVHRPAELEGAAQQRRAPARAARLPPRAGSAASRSQRRAGSAAGGISAPAPERIEQRRPASRRDRDRRPPPCAAAAARAPGQPHESLGHGARGALAGQQQGQPGKAEVGFGIARHQPGGQRIGKAAVRGDRIDLRPAVQPPCAQPPAFSERRSVMRDRRGIADVEPQAVVRPGRSSRPSAIARSHSTLVENDVRRRIAQQPVLDDQLDAGVDERRDPPCAPRA